jgi:hypothetical protein
MDDFTQVMNDSIQRRFALRFVLLLGFVAGLLIGAFAKGPIALGIGLGVLVYFGVITYFDSKSDHAKITPNGSENSD